MNKPEKMNKLPFDQSQNGVILQDMKRFADDRGDFSNVSFKDCGVEFRRCYFINNNHKGIVRAFHGHEKEAKMFYVPRGAFKFILIDSKTGDWKEYSLVASVPKILFVPQGYYNGFVSLSDDSLLVCYSSSYMQDSIADDFRLPYDFLGKDVWGVGYR